MTMKTLTQHAEQFRPGPGFRAPAQTILHFATTSVVQTLRGRGPLIAAKPEATDHDRHLMAGAEWLGMSIDICGGVASSKGYRFPWGWVPPYPETTGYIIPTLLNLSDATGDRKWHLMAEKMGRWLTTVQAADGGFAGYELGSSQKSDVFDTGMILLGFNALQHTSPDARIAEAAAAAAAFLRHSLDDQGAFVRNVSHNMLHTYNVRSAWALVAYGMMTKDSLATEAGLANVDFTLRQQVDNGFFLNNGFKPGGNANTHGIAYVMRGLLQVHLLTQRTDILNAVTRAMDALVSLFEMKGWLAAEIGPDWTFRSRHICLTGCVQLAILGYRLAHLTGRQQYVTLAERLIAQVGSTQSTAAKGKAHYGAIAGSYPIYGAYAPLQYPNWATKFMVDALLVRKAWHQGAGAVQGRDLYGG
jgi:hypothetical protein